MRKKSIPFLAIILSVLLVLQTAAVFAADAQEEGGAGQIKTEQEKDAGSSQSELEEVNTEGSLEEEVISDQEITQEEGTASDGEGPADAEGTAREEEPTGTDLEDTDTEQQETTEKSDEPLPAADENEEEQPVVKTEELKTVTKQPVMLAAPKSTAKIPMSETTIEGIFDKPYNGSPRTHTIKVYYKGEQLVKADCYTVEYANNTKIGNATVTITGKGQFTGSVVIPFKIVDTESKKITLSSGSVLEFKTAVQEHTMLPSKARPYWLRLTAKSNNSIYLKWTDCVEKGGDFTGYIVLRRDGSSGSYKEIAKVSSKYCYYTDKNVSANVKYFYVVVGYKRVDSDTLTRSDLSLTAEGVRYDSTKKNTYAANSDGLKPVASMNKSSASVAKGKTVQLSVAYPSNAISTWTRWRSSDSSIASVNSNGKVTAKKIGTATITARTPAGWDIKCTVTVKKPISDAKVYGVTDKTYTGSPRTHTISVYYSGKKLTKGTDYTVAYKNNTNVGTATVTITGKGSYIGTKSIQFKIKDTYSKTITLASGTKFVFKTSMQVKTRLSSSARPYWLRLTAKKDKSIYLKWTDCVAKGGSFDGYIVLRRDGSSGNYNEIAKVPKSRCYYTDKNVKANVKYFYVVVGYKKVSSTVLTMSEESLTAEGVRYDSTKKNTYAANEDGLTPVAKLNKTTATVTAGKTLQLTLTYPSTAISTWTRWRTSDSTIATVSSTGKVTGKKAGTATITARTPAGWDVKCKVTVKGDPFETYLSNQGFPKTYWPALKKLHQAHPTWTFVAQKTGMTFDTAVQKEYDSGWNYMSTNETNPTLASKKALKYYMDPRNFLTEEYIFQFMDHTETASGTTTTVKRLASLNSDCFMLDSDVFKLSYLTNAANTAGVNANVLTAMIIQEQGWTGGSNSLICGDAGLAIGVYKSSTGKLVKTLKLDGYYNYFNIGAYPSSSVSVGSGYYSSSVNASRRGLWYAAGQPNYKGTMTATSYGRPWNTKQKALTGGARFYKAEYINNNQKTYYTKKFNVMNGVSSVGDHQYETTIYGARDEGVLLAYAYTKYAKNLKFLIPVYNKIDSVTQVKSL